MQYVEVMRTYSELELKIPSSSGVFSCSDGGLYFSLLLLILLLCRVNSGNL